MLIAAVPFLAAGNLPKHAAIGEFRRIHLAVLEGLFVQVLRLAKRNGFFKVGTVAIDGTKEKANAALDQNRTHEDLQKEDEVELRRIAKELLADAERIDQAEDALHGSIRGDELPKSLRAKSERLARIREAKKQLEEEAAASKAATTKFDERARKEEEAAQQGRRLRGRKPLPPDPKKAEDAKRNTTDPDSRILKTRQGYVQGYNAQAAADTESNLILAADITQEANDVHQFNPILHQVKGNTGEMPKRAIGDAGYWSEHELQNAPQGVELLIATTKDWKQRKASREAPAPRGRIPKHLSLKERMERKLLTKRGRRIYKLRGCTIEPRFGCVKEEQGMRGFLLRKGARGEWRLTCNGHKLLRMWRIRRKKRDKK